MPASGDTLQKWELPPLLQPATTASSSGIFAGWEKLMISIETFSFLSLLPRISHSSSDSLIG